MNRGREELTWKCTLNCVFARSPDLYLVVQGGMVALRKVLDWMIASFMAVVRIWNSQRTRSFSIGMLLTKDETWIGHCVGDAADD